MPNYNKAGATGKRIADFRFEQLGMKREKPSRLLGNDPCTDRFGGLILL
jgi:hypothetical protein